MHKQPPSSEPLRPSSPELELQLAVLRHLPTPVIVLSASRIALFANRAAEKILGSPHPIKALGNGITGRRLEELGVRLLGDRKWDVVLDEVLNGGDGGKEERNNTRSGAKESVVDGHDIVIDNPRLKAGERDYRILLNILEHGGEAHYVLAFEKSTHTVCKDAETTLQESNAEDYNAPQGKNRTLPLRLSPLSRELSLIDPNETVPDENPRHDVSRLKLAIFDSCLLTAFIISADECFYLTNKKTREVLGEILGGSEGCDGLSMRAGMEVWDENFSRKLDVSEYPGVKLVRSREGFTGYRCGFLHMVSGKQIVMSVDGECLYDDQTEEFLGGICVCVTLTPSLTVEGRN